MGHEFTVRKAEERYPGGERRGTVLMLPGRAYSCGMSLLAWTTRALQATGWTVLQAEWDLSAVPAEPRVFIQDVAQQLDEMKRPAEPVLIVAKSLGALAAHWGLRRGTRLSGSRPSSRRLAGTRYRATAMRWQDGSASIRLTI